MPRLSNFKRLAVVLGFAAIAGVVWLFLLPLFSSPESMVHNAKRVEFVRESYYADGGSVGFNFLAKPRGQFEIFVKHRQDGMGGNPGFQEIFIRLGRKLTVLEPESRLEKDVLGLLSAAVLNTNHWQNVGEPKQERLQWLVERMKNRTTP